MQIHTHYELFTISTRIITTKTLLTDCIVRKLCKTAVDIKHKIVHAVAAAFHVTKIISIPPVYPHILSYGSYIEMFDLPSASIILIRMLPAFAAE